MSKKEDLIHRLKSKPKDFTIYELDSLMRKCGCEKSNRGKTSGSAIAYVHTATGRAIKIHTPHPGNELKPYAIEDIILFLELVGEI